MEMWDIESKRHNKELELWAYWQYFEDLERELVRATPMYPEAKPLVYPHGPRKKLTPVRDCVGELVLSSWK